MVHVEVNDDHDNSDRMADGDHITKNLYNIWFCIGPRLGRFIHMCYGIVKALSVLSSEKIPILVRRHLYTETAPRNLTPLLFMIYYSQLGLFQEDSISWQGSHQLQPSLHLSYQTFSMSRLHRCAVRGLLSFAIMFTFTTNVTTIWKSFVANTTISIAMVGANDIYKVAPAIYWVFISL